MVIWPSETIARRRSFIVTGDNDTGTLVISSGLDALNDWNGIEFGSSGTRKAGIFFERTGNNYVGRLHFAMDNTQDASEATLSDAKMTIADDGKIGIGTTAPVTTLDVEGDITIGNQDRLYFDGGSHTYICETGGSTLAFVIADTAVMCLNDGCIMASCCSLVGTCFTVGANGTGCRCHIQRNRKWV